MGEIGEGGVAVLLARRVRTLWADSTRQTEMARSFSFLAALSLKGMGAAMILEGSADTTAFELYVEQILAPSLHAGQIVVMDSASST
jgi:hypothetical protein